MAKIPTVDNPSDLGTKVHPASRFIFLLELSRIGPAVKARSTPERKVAHAVPKAAAGAAAVGALCAEIPGRERPPVGGGVAVAKRRLQRQSI